MNKIMAFILCTLIANSLFAVQPSHRRKASCARMVVCGLVAACLAVGRVVAINNRVSDADCDERRAELVYCGAYHQDMDRRGLALCAATDTFVARFCEGR